MFENFGEFNTFEEINELAENLFNEGDMESIKTLAKENGIPSDMAKMYINGDLPCLCDAMTAAVGKLDVEARELKLKGLMKDWVSYIEVECEESEEVARAVRRKDKSLMKCIAELLKYSFANQWTVPQGIIKEAGVKASKVTFGVPGMGKAREIIAGYYGKGGKK